MFGGGPSEGSVYGGVEGELIRILFFVKYCSEKFYI